MYLISLSIIFTTLLLTANTNNRFLWIRNNASTIVSQGIDTTIFVLVAFIGTYSIHEIWNMIWITYLIKISIAIMDTPLIYLLVHLSKSKNFKP